MDIVLTGDNGEIVILNSFIDKLKNDKEKIRKAEQDNYILYNEYVIPYVTLNLLLTNTRGVSLSRMNCPHCRIKLIMTTRAITRYECEWCCKCGMNLYDSTNKKKQIRKW